MTRSHFIEMLMILTKYVVFDVNVRLTEYSVTLRFYCSLFQVLSREFRIIFISLSIHYFNLGDMFGVLNKTERMTLSIWQPVSSQLAEINGPPLKLNNCNFGMETDINVTQVPYNESFQLILHLICDLRICCIYINCTHPCTLF